MKSKNQNVAVFVSYTSPGSYPVMGNAVEQMIANGWDVLVLGVSATGSAASLTLDAREGLRQETLSPPGGGYRNKLHFLWFTLWAFWKSARSGAQILHCVERYATPTGVLVNALLRKEVLYSEYDPPGQPRSVADRLVFACRKRIAKKAVACIIPNSERESDFINELAPTKTLMIWNAVSKREIRAARESRIADEPLCLWYQGSLHPGQLAKSVVDAIAKVPETQLKFVGFSSPAWKHYPDELESRADELGIGDRVEYLGTPATRDELYERSAVGHVGLILFKVPFRDPMAGASQKAFEYMAAGMPLLVPDIPEWNRFAVDNGFGRSCDPADPSSIAHQLRWFVDNPVETREMGRNCRRQVLEEWNFERVFQPVIELLSSHTSTRKS